MRSLLFVPGDSERKLTRSGTVPADVIIIDLEDSVVPPVKAQARQMVADHLTSLSAEERSRVWVRVNPINTPDFNADLGAIMRQAPAGIMLPKTQAPADVESLAHRLGTYEAEYEIPVGATAILPVATETPAALFTLGQYVGCSPRLAGLTWGAEDLSTAVGASTARHADGRWTAPYRLVRSLCLFAAHAAQVEAIDTLYPDFRDSDGLEHACAEARRDGFTGKLAIHPAQVETINRLFTPSAEEVEHARRIVELFEANPGQGVLALDGIMLDRPHLLQAQKILDRAQD